MGEKGKKGFHRINIQELKRVTEGITGVKNTILKEWIEVVKHRQNLLKKMSSNFTSVKNFYALRT